VCRGVAELDDRTGTGGHDFAVDDDDRAERGLALVLR
jgi:hypothetical protein